MTLFSALLPPAEAIEALRAELDRLGAGGDGLRWEPPERWHITLGFYGVVEDEKRQVDWLRERLRGHPAPTLRLAGSGTFPGVLWIGVDGSGVLELGTAAGAGREGREYHPHLTLARARRAVPSRWKRRLAGFRGEPWTAAEAVLMRSERDDRGPRYTVVEAFPLPAQRADRGSE
ncbi:RNA 2',3'-cyclic phosphodiesterase [Amycolatopsis anabasis]|uniref:RNA 2',3'-cyclic phosphodiesterase n=1 Tax=Amycolatopsis anabasis TaxID=1840409 RepID=UPI00131AAE66|nr:RNA 2',3'-cyclic phosphodiesterase [Amycolatopsis anabasis]